MKRLSCVVFLVIALLSTTPAAFSMALGQEEQETKTQPQTNPLSGHITHSQWSFDDSDDEEFPEEELEAQEKDLTLRARAVKRYEEAKLLMKMGYNAKIRPLIRKMEKHKNAIYGTAASVTAVLALLYGVKKFKKNQGAGKDEGQQPAATGTDTN